jgi:glycosyltransferase involved in cell wall biosynthesis
MNLTNSSKVAIVYDRVNKFGGAERVLLALHEMFPKAPLYTSVYDKKKASWADVFPRIYTTFLQKMPVLKKHHELLGWLTPIAFERFNFSDYDLVISVTSEAAKGIITGTSTFHLCYLLTPTRYLWSGRRFYLSHPPKIFKIFPFYRIISWPFLTYATWWDKIASQRPDKIVAISSEVKRRIKKYYNRESEIVFPPVYLMSYNLKNKNNDKKYYFIHGRFEPYKRLDLVINVFNKLGLPLVVSGTGSEFNIQKKRAKKNIKFVFKPDDKELVKLYMDAKAFLMPQEEDFGITSLEAQSFGIPVIAYKKGGALDTVVDEKTGILFNDQTEKSLILAIQRFDTISFDRRYLVNNAKKFSKENFIKNFSNIIKNI